MRSSVALLALLVAGCTTPTAGTDVGNGVVAVNLEARGVDGRAVPRLLDLATGERIDSATVIVSRIRLEPGTDCTVAIEDDGRSEVEGPVTADLVGAGFGEPLAFEVEATTFCEIRMRIASDAGTPVVVVGARADGVPFEVRSDDEVDLRVRSRGAPFELAEGEVSLLLAVDVGSWIEALGLDGLTPGADGVIRVNDESDDDAIDEALERFEEALETSVRLLRDGDDDGEVDDDEDDDPLAG